MDHLKFNAEGYKVSTAYQGMKKVMKEEREADKRANDLIRMLKFVIRSCDFELLERVQLRDIKSGREYR